MSSPEELAAAARAHQRAYDEETIRQQIADQEAHRQRRAQHGDSVSRTDSRGRTVTRNAKLVKIGEGEEDVSDDPRVPVSENDPGLHSRERISGEGPVVHRYEPKDEDERKTLSRLKVWK